LIALVSSSLRISPSGTACSIDTVTSGAASTAMRAAEVSVARIDCASVRA
jgi:hypothetical protein